MDTKIFMNNSGCDMDLQAENADKKCFHCGKIKNMALHCEVWDVFTCQGCIKQHHARHHDSCRPNDESAESAKKVGGAEASRFFILVNRFDGVPTRIQCERGRELPMEDHWAGTYIYHAAGLILVKESRDTINQLVLDGLKSLTHAGKKI